MPFRHLRAAQLRARAVRGGLVKVAFGTVFLVGALAHALSPERHEQSSLFWISLLLMMSTVNVALGLRSLGRASRRSRPAAGEFDAAFPERSVRQSAGRSFGEAFGGAWLVISLVWGVLSVVLLGMLLRR